MVVIGIKQGYPRRFVGHLNGGRCFSVCGQGAIVGNHLEADIIAPRQRVNLQVVGGVGQSRGQKLPADAAVVAEKDGVGQGIPIRIAAGPGQRLGCAGRPDGGGEWIGKQEYVLR